MSGDKALDEGLVKLKSKSKLSSKRKKQKLEQITEMPSAIEEEKTPRENEDYPRKSSVNNNTLSGQFETPQREAEFGRANLGRAPLW